MERARHDSRNQVASEHRAQGPTRPVIPDQAPIARATVLAPESSPRASRGSGRQERAADVPPPLTTARDSHLDLPASAHNNDAALKIAAARSEVRRPSGASPSRAVRAIISEANRQADKPFRIPCRD